MSERRAAVSAQSEDTTSPGAGAGSAPLSYGQERMWLLSQLLPDGGSLGLTTAVRLRGRLNLVALRHGFDDVLRRHEVLRAVVTLRDGKPVQAPGPRRRVPFRVVTLAGLPAEIKHDCVNALMRAEARRPFDLGRGPLLRVTVAALGPADHLVIIAMHHIVTDDWSIGLMARELSALYRAYLGGAPSPHGGTPVVQYRDFARRQRTLEWDEGLAFWVDALHDPPAGEVPSARRVSESRREAATWTYALPPSLTGRLRVLQRREGGSLFMLVLAALMTLLRRLDGRDDVVVGTLAAGRTRPELETLLGFFVNALVVRCVFDDRPTFRELWRRVRESCIAAYEHQDVPYEKILERLRPELAGQAAPLVHVLCVAQQPPPPLDLAGLDAQPVDVEHGTAQFDLVVEVRERADSVRLAIKYDTDLFDEASVRRLGRYLRTLLEGVTEDPDADCDALPLERDARPSPTPVGPSAADGLCVHELFEQQVERTPDAVAISHGGRWLTYRSLNARSNRLARYLHALGVGAEDRVGICLDRSAESTIALLAVLKAGAAYVPLDPGYPADRLTYMLEDSAARCVITTAELLDRLGGATHPVLLDRDWPAIAAHPDTNVKLPVSVDNLAYVVYTSGTTGRPKGVLGPHRGAINRFRWMWCAYPFEPGERTCHRTALSFVDSVWEVFGPLLRGVPAEVIDAETVLYPGRLADALARARVTRIVVVPALLRMMLDAVPDLDRRIPDLRIWVTSGERLPAEVAARFHAVLPGRMLLNLYGSAEVAADATVALIDPAQRDSNIPIGHPIDNITTVTIDARGRPAPALVTGELYVAGAGTARGYHGRPGETAAKFGPAPNGPPGSRAFHSGDLVRLRPNGALEFLGRLDDQIQIRGHRAEPGEVEEVLLRHPAVTAAAVAPWADATGSASLMACVVLDSPCTTTELRAFARKALPAPLVPSAVNIVDALPHTPSGKVDRRRLPSPDAATLVEQPEAVAPATPAEEAVAGVFAELLPTRWRSVHDDFFALGGHSILAAQVVQRVSGRCGADIGLRDLFAAPTITELARVVEQRIEGGLAPSGPSVTPWPEEWYEPFPLTDVQQAYWIGRAPDWELGKISTHAYFEVDAEKLDVSRLTDAVQRLIDRHHSLRTVIRPDGTQQVLRQVAPYKIDVADLRSAAPDTTESRLAEIRERMSHQVLSAETWPLFEIQVSLLARERARIHVSIDALIADAYSVHVLMGELGQIYRCPDVRLQPLDLTFRDCVVAAMSERESPRYQRALTYWRERLPELPSGPELPLQRTPDTVDVPRFSRRTARLSRVAWDRLAEHAARSGLTPSGVLLAAFSEMLTTWSRRPHYSLTLTLFNRMVGHPQADQVIGDFTSLVVLEVDHRVADTFVGRAQRLQARLWQDLDNRAVSGVAVMREWTRSRGGPPRLIAPVVFTSNLGLTPEPDAAVATDASGGLGQLGFGITQTPQLYLDHQVAETPDGLTLNWDVVDELFPPGLVDDMFGAYVGLLERLAADPECWAKPVRDLLPAAQRRRRALANGTDGPRSRSCLHTLVAMAAAERPAAPAVVTPGRRLCYGELVQRAAGVAQRLHRLGVGRGQLVGIAMTKGWEQVVATLGVSACGAAYVPLDPDLPAERMSYLAGEIQLEHVLTQSALRGRLPGLERVNQLAVDADGEWPHGGGALPEYGVEDGDLAYVVFTSGSTGAPKGVMIDHRGAVNTIVDINRRFTVGSSDRVLALSSLSFDLSVYDVFGALAAGGVVVIPDQARRRDPAHWIDLITAERVTIWNSVPALMGLAVDYAESAAKGLHPLRLAMLSGDWIPVGLPDRIRRLAESVEVIGLGGATEASIWSVFYPIEAVPAEWTSIPYGRPLTNQRLHVLDPALEPRPEWTAGDLYISGIGLALGYWRDAERTAQSFLTHPRTGERLYRTGDLARYRDDGNLEFLGREDLQVKVGGNRVELGEIETTLADVPGIARCAVAALGPREEKRLAAYYVPDPGEAPDPGTLRDALLAKLPAYLVPSTFTQLETLPLTSNGKVDRAALTAAAEPARPIGSAAVTRLEQRLAEIWAELLEVDQVGRDDNFFQLGGTSLVAVRLLARLQATLRVRISLTGLYKSPTIAELATAIVRARGTGLPRAEAEELHPLTPAPADRYEPFPLTDIQEAYWLGRRGALQLGNVATHSYVELDVAGLDVGRLEQAVRRLVARHDALRTVVLADGRQRTLADVNPYQIDNRDLRDLAPDTAQTELAAARRSMSHQVRPADQWPLFEIKAHRLDERRTRLHVSIDLLIADARSFRILQRELLSSYEDENAALPPIGCSFRDYVLAAQALRAGSAYRRAEQYWRERLLTLAPAPPLPLIRDLAEIERPRFQRLEGRIDAPDWATLQRLARDVNVTPSGVLCAAFAEVLAMWSQRGRFTINLTTFNRHPLHPDVDALVGDFTSTTLLTVDASAATFTERAGRLQERILSDLEHRLFSGVEVARLLRGDPRRRMDAIAPIVFTSALVPEPAATTAQPRWEVEPVYSVSQTPQVLLDHQVYQLDDGLLYTWDHVAEAFPPGVIDAMFDAFGRLLNSLVTDRAYWKADPAWSL